MTLSGYLGALGSWVVKICATVVMLGMVLIAVLGTVYFVSSLLIPRSIQAGILDWIGLGQEAKAVRETAMLNGDLDAARREVYPDVYSVLAKVATCSGSYLSPPTEFMKVAASEQQAAMQQTNGSLQDWQAANLKWLQQLKQLAPQQQQEQWAQMLLQWQQSTPQQNTEPQPKMRDFTKAETRLMQLNYAIAHQRVEERSTAQEAYRLHQISTLTSILIGMITTVLVSLNAAKILDETNPYSRAMRILAIVFPAVGTAFAAAIAFYTPQATWTQASRKWADLSQLHSQISLGVWDIDCKASDYDKQFDAKIEGWSRGFSNIQTLSTGNSPQTIQNVGERSLVKAPDKNQQEKPDEQPRLPPPAPPLQQPG